MSPLPDTRKRGRNDGPTQGCTHTMTQTPGETVYRTGSGGRRQARAITLMVTVYLGVIALAWGAYDRMGVPRSDAVFHWVWPLFLIAALGLAWALSCSLRESRGRAVVAAEGLTVTDWRGRTTLHAWEAVRAVGWQHNAARFCEEHWVLHIHAEDEHGYIMPVSIGYNCYQLDDDLVALRDAIIREKGFERARGVAPGFWERAANMLSNPLEYDLWK